MDKLEIDVRSFFTDPPRLKEEVKLFIHRFLHLFYDKLLSIFKAMNISRVHVVDVRMAIFICVKDPILMYTNEGLFVQQTKLRSMHRILSRSIDKAMEHDGNVGGINRKFIRMCKTHFKTKTNMCLTMEAVVAIVACATETCGIVLNTANRHTATKTLTLKDVKATYYRYKTSGGEQCINNSLIRLMRNFSDEENLFDGYKKKDCDVPTECSTRKVSFEPKNGHDTSSNGSKQKKKKFEKLG